MLTFVINQDDPISLKKTLSCLPKDTRVEVIPQNQDLFKKIKKSLQDYHEPFFITLFAGDYIQPAVWEKVLTQLPNLSDSCAGITFHSFSSIHAPFLWRTAWVHSLLEHESPFPFPDYLFKKWEFQLAKHGQWERIPLSPTLFHTKKEPAWRKRNMEWKLIQPIIQREPIINGSSSNPSISVVICTYNEADYLPWAIRSLFIQTMPDWELIIVDDASTDHTTEYLSQLKKKDRITILRNPVNCGKAKSLNLALNVAKGNWLLELDTDDWLTPDCLERLLSHSSHSQAALIYGDYYEWVERWNREVIYSGVVSCPNRIDPKLLFTKSRPITPRMYQINALKDLGGWITNDPFEGRLYEDFQMLIRLQNHLHQHLPLPLYHRRIRKDSITHREQGKFVEWVTWMKKIANPFTKFEDLNTN